ncbi:MAG TPA: recombinase family protein [Solidesulfovibrio magneticus]|nr:recombinase family protein [Solidesulfovibrio magneticus]
MQQRGQCYRNSEILQLNTAYTVAQSRLLDKPSGSGKCFDRPGLSEMMSFAREGDTLCVVRLDRLGRSMKELLEVMDHLKACQVEFRSLEEQLDTTTAAGFLIFHVFAALTDFERRLIAERTRDGLAVAMAKGHMPGRPKIETTKITQA